MSGVFLFHLDTWDPFLPEIKCVIVYGAKTTTRHLPLRLRVSVLLMLNLGVQFLGSVDNGQPVASTTTAAAKVTDNGGGSSSNRETPATTATAKEEEVTEQDGEVSARNDAAGAANERAAGEDASPSADDGEEGESVRKKRAMSPGTLALMCDEQDTLFTAPSSPSGASYSGGHRPYGTTLYAEQERVILSEMVECLRKLVAVGKKRGTIHTTGLEKRRTYCWLVSDVVTVLCFQNSSYTIS